MKDREWYIEQIDNLQDWLLDEQICKTENEVEKQVYYSVLHKIIDVFCGEDKDDDYWDNLLEVFSEL